MSPGRSTSLQDRCALVLLLGALALSTACRREQLAADAPGEWRQWRGPSGQGVSAETGLPRRWAAGGKNVRWKTAIPGLGNSSPIVSRGRVFLTTSYGPERQAPRNYMKQVSRAVLGIDLATGEILWETSVFAGPLEKRHWLNTPATPTPVADGERVYVYLGKEVAALDYDGRVLWQVDVDPGYLKKSRYGVAASPIVTAGAVIVSWDDEWGRDEDRSWIAAFDKRTGRELWKTEREDTCCSYATPYLLESEGGPQIIVPSSPFVVAYDAESGEILWSRRHRLTQVVASSVARGDLFTVGGSIHDKGLYALRLTSGARDAEPELLWEMRRATPEMSSPVLYRDRLFTLSDRGIMSVLDPESGEVLKQKRIPRGPYRASLVAADGMVYAAGSEGRTVVLRADEKLKVVAVNDIGEEVRGASPAIAGGCFLLRTVEHLYCIARTKDPRSEGQPGEAKSERSSGDTRKGKDKRGKTRSHEAAAS